MKGASSPVLVEAAVESLEAALTAEQCGAGRIELCADLAHDGTTPAPNLIAACVARLSIPCHVMIRPRPGDFVYTAEEVRTMHRDVVRARELGAAGIVLGALRPDRSVDAVRTTALIAAARPLPVTFHRAFDTCADLDAALTTLIELGVERVLTSGGAPGGAADLGLANLARLSRAAAGRIGILPGGGVNERNVRAIVAASGATEVHAGLRRLEDAAKIRGMVAALASP